MRAIIDIFSGIEYDEMMPLLQNHGFDGFFSRHDFAPVPEKIGMCRQLADKYGMIYETSHSLIHGCTGLWLDGSDGDDYTAIMAKCVDNCAEYNIPVLVVHIQVEEGKPNNLEKGLIRLKKVVAYAYKKGVRIAFENINSPEFLIETLGNFKDENVGFCYDNGHNYCYAPDVDYLDIVGDRLICTHIHDNFGDADSHLIPFEGNFDFERMCTKLSSLDYKGNLTLEMSYNSYKDRFTKDEFILECKKSYDKLKIMMR